jgi:hypothetical protein
VRWIGKLESIGEMAKEVRMVPMAVGNLDTGLCDLQILLKVARLTQGSQVTILIDLLIRVTDFAEDVERDASDRAAPSASNAQVGGVQCDEAGG